MPSQPPLGSPAATNSLHGTIPRNLEQHPQQQERPEGEDWVCPTCGARPIILECGWCRSRTPFGSVGGVNHSGTLDHTPIAVPHADGAAAAARGKLASLASAAAGADTDGDDDVAAAVGRAVGAAAESAAGISPHECDRRTKRHRTSAGIPPHECNRPYMGPYHVVMGWSPHPASKRGRVAACAAAIASHSDGWFVQWEYTSDDVEGWIPFNKDMNRFIEAARLERSPDIIEDLQTYWAWRTREDTGDESTRDIRRIFVRRPLRTSRREGVHRG